MNRRTGIMARAGKPRDRGKYPHIPVTGSSVWAWLPVGQKSRTAGGQPGKRFTGRDDAVSCDSGAGLSMYKFGKNDFCMAADPQVSICPGEHAKIFIIYISPNKRNTNHKNS